MRRGNGASAQDRVGEAVYTNTLSRRRFLRLVSLAGLGASAVACGFGVPDMQQANEMDRAPDTWMDDVIVYGVVPRSFGLAPFTSVTKKLADLQDLGVNAIWLSPCHATLPGDFGYAVTDYFKLRQDYGNEDEFRALVQEAHARGIRVLMDFVPNHTSEHHPYFMDAQANGKVSEYYDWYDRDAQGQYTHYFDWPHLPNLNLDNPKVADWMLEAMSYWIKEFDVDGYRVDVAWGIKERKPELWAGWTRALKRLKPQVLLIAEASARDSYYIENGFDAAYDWTDELGHWAWERVFENQASLVHRLHAALTNEGRGYAPGTRVFRFLNNNDTGLRFVTLYGPGMTRVAVTLLLTLPGIPCIYTGDEVGAAWQPYETTLPISWEDQYDMRPHYKQLIALRKSMPSLRSLHWQPVEVAEAGQVYAYLRYVQPVEQPALVVLNFAGNQREPVLHLPDEFRILSDSPTLRDVLANEDVSVENSESLRISMRPWTARVLTVES
jgi:cyclomaltodextrinase / maltogenic alpha-amylase / neopullulanase